MLAIGWYTAEGLQREEGGRRPMTAALGWEGGVSAKIIKPKCNNITSGSARREDFAHAKLRLCDAPWCAMMNNFAHHCTQRNGEHESRKIKLPGNAPAETNRLCRFGYTFGCLSQLGLHLKNSKKKRGQFLAPRAQDLKMGMNDASHTILTKSRASYFLFFAWAGRVSSKNDMKTGIFGFAFGGKKHSLWTTWRRIRSEVS